jgi:hypothetical protein
MIFCDVTISDYTPRTCGVDFAGVVGLGLIHLDQAPTQEELEDPEFWYGQSLSDPKRYFVIKNTRGSYEGAEPVIEEDLVGFTTTGANHQALIDVPEVHENRNFWDQVSRFNWKVFLITSGGLAFFIDQPVSFYPKIVNPKGIKQAAYFQVQMKWTGISNPFIYEEPEGIFTGSAYIPTGSGIFDYTFDYTFE